MKQKELYKKCKHCTGTGKIKIRPPYMLTTDTKRMLRVMKKHELTQTALAKILGISQGAVNGWFHRKTNLNGKIKPIYFQMLRNLGYL